MWTSLLVWVQSFLMTTTCITRTPSHVWRTFSSLPEQGYIPNPHYLFGLVWIVIWDYHSINIYRRTSFSTMCIPSGSKLAIHTRSTSLPSDHRKLLVLAETLRILHVQKIIMSRQIARLSSFCWRYNARSHAPNIASLYDNSFWPTRLGKLITEYHSRRDIDWLIH